MSFLSETMIKGDNMLTWYTTAEWIALQFHKKDLEDLTEIESNIAKKLIQEGLLDDRTINSTDGTQRHKLFYTHFVPRE